jgi:molybdopterin-guanine dinucleotide biosynthesis protein A
MGGGDKPLVTVGGRPMLEHVIERLRPQADRTIINANGDPARFASFGLPVVADTIGGYAGPLAGILAGIHWTRSSVPAARFVLTVAADTPFFPLDLFAGLRVASNADERTISIAASEDGMHPVFGLWPVALADDLEAFLMAGESGKILAFVDRYPNVSAHFPAYLLSDGGTADPFFNVNTREDAAQAEVVAAALTGAGG